MMSGRLRDRLRGLRGLAVLFVLTLTLLTFASYTQENPYDRDVSILLLTKSIEERDAFVDLIIANRDFKRIDVHAVDEQKNLRFSKYELIVLPSGIQGLKERLNKYFETGTGIFIYGAAGSGDINQVFGIAGDSEDFIIQGSGEGSTAKLGKIKLAKSGNGKDYHFDIAGRYCEPGSFIRVDIADKENYEYKILRALVDIHNDTRLRDFGSKSPARISLYSYLGDGSTVIRQFLSLYRDYAYDVQGFYHFKLVPELELKTGEGELDELAFCVDTNELASMLEISPKHKPNIHADVDKGRQQANYRFSSPLFLPGNLSGKVFHSSQSFLISGEELSLRTTVHPRIYYGSFKQHELYPEAVGKRDYTIEVSF